MGFQAAKLDGANFSKAVLKDANLDRASIIGTVFNNANLTGATWTDGQTCAKYSQGTCITGP